MVHKTCQYWPFIEPEAKVDNDYTVGKTTKTSLFNTKNAILIKGAHGFIINTIILLILPFVQ
jgi:hypothetical protein